MTLQTLSHLVLAGSQLSETWYAHRGVRVVRLRSHACSQAASDIDTVNGLWKGLGYYSRAARLLSGAQKAVAELGGRLPDNAQDMESKIPGIGRYSAGAICSIAYNQCEPVVSVSNASVMALPHWTMSARRERKSIIEPLLSTTRKPKVQSHAGHTMGRCHRHGQRSRSSG